MGLLGDLIKAASDMVTGSRRDGGAPSRDAEVLPGEFGPDATVEVDPYRIGPVRMSYSPRPDGDPDPGEVVWTWVPFEENDGRGKDRPVLVVAAESAGTYLALQLTSKDHDGDGDFVSVGAGAWDGEHRPSWVSLDRVIRVHEGGMRREAAALPREPFERVTGRLHQRYGWR
jgi:PemK-like, MazF-like toxin of type II toxin-antitoxin system